MQKVSQAAAADVDLSTAQMQLKTLVLVTCSQALPMSMYGCYNTQCDKHNTELQLAEQAKYGHYKFYILYSHFHITYCSTRRSAKPTAQCSRYET